MKKDKRMSPQGSTLISEWRNCFWCTEVFFGSPYGLCKHCGRFQPNESDLERMTAKKKKGGIE